MENGIKGVWLGMSAILLALGMMLLLCLFEAYQRQYILVNERVGEDAVMNYGR